MSKSPDVIVAEKILVDLQTQKLLGDVTLEALGPLLVKGSIRSEDWRVLIEKELAQTKGTDNATKN